MSRRARSSAWIGTSSAVRGFERHAHRFYPGLKGATLTIRWGGKLPMTRNYLPRLVTIERALHAADGWHGRGIALATAMGKRAAERIRGISHPDLPIANLPPSRYPFHRLRAPAMMVIRRLRTHSARA